MLLLVVMYVYILLVTHIYIYICIWYLFDIGLVGFLQHFQNEIVIMNNITRTLDKVAILATAMIENRIYHCWNIQKNSYFKEKGDRFLQNKIFWFLPKLFYWCVFFTLKIKHNSVLFDSAKTDGKISGKNLLLQLWPKVLSTSWIGVLLHHQFLWKESTDTLDFSAWS